MTSAAAWRDSDTITGTDGEFPPVRMLALAPIAIEVDQDPQLNAHAATVLARIIRAHLTATRPDQSLEICPPKRRDCQP